MTNLADELLALMKFFSKIHHTPGRLRVRVSLKIKSELKGLDLDDLEKKFKQITSIGEVKFNPLIASVTINYDKNLLEPDFWELLLSDPKNESVKNRLNELLKA